MIKDIEFPNVEGIKVAVAKQVNELNQTIWNTYLINKLALKITGVMVTARGYGERDGQSLKTATTRHFIGDLPARSHCLIEPIDAGIFHLNNEYWVSYFIDNQIYDKKFIFVPESIATPNLIYIDSLKLDGVLHE
jgi:hypothetical protein